MTTQLSSPVSLHGCSNFAVVLSSCHVQGRVIQGESSVHHSVWLGGSSGWRHDCLGGYRQSALKTWLLLLCCWCCPAGQGYKQLSILEADIQRKLTQGEGDPEYWEVGSTQLQQLLGVLQQCVLTEAPCGHC